MPKSRDAKTNGPNWTVQPATGAGLLSLLIFLSVTNPFAFHVFLPSLPGLVQALDASPATAQLTVSFYVAAFAFAQLAYGPLSDRFGRRRTILVGLTIYTAAPLLCASADSIEMLVFGRALQAVGGCAGLMFARVIARDLHERDRAASVIGFVTMVTALATAATPLLGGYLDAWFGWRASFWFAAGLGLLVWTATYLWLPETRPAGPAKSVVQTLVEGVRLLRVPAFLGYAGHATCTLSAWYVALAGLPYVMVEVLGEPQTAFGLYYPILAIGYMLGNLVTSRVASSWGIGKLIAVGAGLAVLGCLVMYIWCGLFTPVPLALFLPMSLVVIGHGISQPGAHSGALGVRPELAGSAAGMMGFGQWLTAAIASQLVGISQNGTVWPTVHFVTFFSVLSLFCYGLARMSEERAHLYPSESSGRR